jgi:hypothetical protein
MADYTVTTTDEQEVSLEYAYTYYGTGGETKDQFLQRRVNSAVLDPMVLSQKSDAQIAFQQSIATIPEANKPQAQEEIKNVIVANGGTVFPAQPALSPIAIAERVTRGTLPIAR